MRLNERVGGIFLAREPARERVAFSNSLERFLVPDRGTDREELEVVLLVASPHTDEVCDGYPLAGNSGTRIRNALDRCCTERSLPDGSIGRLIYDNHPDFLRLGIMNVSQLPFEREAYEPSYVHCVRNDCRNRREWINYVRHMRTIFNGPERDRRNHRNCKYLDDAISENLRGRLDCLHSRKPNVLLVRCGNVAQEFYRKAINRPPACPIDRQPICDLPHPANRGTGGERWEGLDCQNECLRRIVAALGPQPGNVAREER